MKKIIYFILAIVCSLIFMSCGKSSLPNEVRIKEDLIEAGVSLVSIDNPFLEYNDYSEFEIQSVEIEKRETDNRDDTVYCAISMRNEWYSLEKNLTLLYHYYDQGGWILDDYSDNGNITWEVIKSPFTSENLEQLKTNTFFIYEYVGNPTIEENLTDGVFAYSFPVEETHTYGVYRGNYIYRFAFTGTGWDYTEDDAVSFIWNLAGHQWLYHDETPESWMFRASERDVSVTVTDVNSNSQSLWGTWSMMIDDPSRLLSYDFNVSLSLSGGEIETEFYSDRIELVYSMYASVTGKQVFRVVFSPDNVELKSLFIGDHDLELVQ